MRVGAFVHVLHGQALIGAAPTIGTAAQANRRWVIAKGSETTTQLVAQPAVVAVAAVAPCRLALWAGCESFDFRAGLNDHALWPGTRSLVFMPASSPRPWSRLSCA